MNDTITTRELKRSDVGSVLDLLRSALGETSLLRRTVDLFSWKHFDNPFGESIALVALSGNRLVGLRTFMRWHLTTQTGERVRCVRAVDTATHPDFHRRGIFRRLTEEAVDLAQSQGVDLIFNTPNPKSGSGYLKMGWSEVGEIGVLVRPKAGLVFRGRPEVSPAPPSEIDLSGIADRQPFGLRTPRSAEYLAWRFASHPTARYADVQAANSTAIVRSSTRKGRPELLIADVFGSHPELSIRKAARDTRAWYLAGWFSVGTPERAASLRAGLLPIPGMSALTLMAKPLTDLDIDISSMSSWDLALSDLELL